MRRAALALLLVPLGCRAPSAGPRASESVRAPPPAASAVPAAVDAGATPAHAEAEHAGEFVLGSGKLTLPDGTTVERVSSQKWGLPGDHVEFLGPPESSGYSYIAPGDAEVIGTTWLFVRGADTRRDVIRRWEPRTVELSKRGAATLHLGDRIKAGPWSVEWVGVVPGAEGGTRVMALRALHDGAVTDTWNIGPDSGTTHDFASQNGLHHFHVVVTRAEFAREATDSTLALDGREINRASRAALGTPLAPGLYALPGDLRVLFAKTRNCATGPKECRCHDSFVATAELDGREVRVYLVRGQSSTALGRSFAMRGDRLVVSR